MEEDNEEINDGMDDLMRSVYLIHPEVLRQRREGILAQAEVTVYNVGDKALKALYHKDMKLLKAIIEKYVLPLQQE